MKKTFLYLLLLLSIAVEPALAGKELRVEQLLQTAADFDKALISRDTFLLLKLTSPQLSYGHSNGWIEDRKDFTADLYNGKLVYKSIKSEADVAAIIEGSTGIIRRDCSIDILLDGKPLTIKLKIMQVWINQQGKWTLLGRQSVKAS